MRPVRSSWLLVAVVLAFAACSGDPKRVCQSGPKGTQCYTVPDHGPPQPDGR